ncbi:hypothetical protein THAOC_37185 [Thalassiosira oceanica]|uniref:Uncharacterized protein n=1 Tax=Thalassiosira oceanica TaxID=159749 RepID=K0QZ34_THAOC|nr:hypothetical protein THAOC_37185 [Thalassiosira oceanica]|eukprot:EJK44285.1 hypothetical protein THAOC_37185 [Thalassiosira oceanica]
MLSAVNSQHHGSSHAWSGGEGAVKRVAGGMAAVPGDFQPTAPLARRFPAANRRLSALLLIISSKRNPQAEESGTCFCAMSQQWWDLDDGTTGGSRRRRAAQAAKRRNQEKESRRKQLKSCSSSATEDGKKSSDLYSERPSHHRHTGHERGTRQRAAGHVIQRPEHHAGACQADSDDSSISVECSQRSKSTLRRTRFRFDASESSNDETDEPLTREKRREIDLRLARHKKAKRAGLIDDSKPSGSGVTRMTWTQTRTTPRQLGRRGGQNTGRRNVLNL